MNRNKANFPAYILILIVLPFLFYFRFFSQYFIAEDFILIRYWSHGFGLWRIKEFFTSPFLG
ncbi:MAG: hypothetical protein WCY34_04275, partial [Candidatus Omnitrophota bacterium]